MKRSNVQELCQKEFHSNRNEFVDRRLRCVRKLDAINPLRGNDFLGSKIPVDGWNLDFAIAFRKFRFKSNLVGSLLFVIEFRIGST